MLHLNAWEVQLDGCKKAVNIIFFENNREKLLNEKSSL
jgi:hypothetical protein